MEPGSRAGLVGAATVAGTLGCALGCFTPADPPGEGRPPRLELIGPPGAGKSTQIAAIVAKYGVVTIGVGAITRDHIKRGTELGRRAAANDAASKATGVPQSLEDPLLLEAVLERLRQPDCRERGWLLDGWSRTAVRCAQLAEVGVRPDIVLSFAVPDEVVIDRIAGRRLDPATGRTYHVRHDPPPPGVRVQQRYGDTEEVVRIRLKVGPHPPHDSLDPYIYVERRRTRGTMALWRISSGLCSARSTPTARWQMSRARSKRRWQRQPPPPAGRCRLRLEAGRC